MELEDLLVFEQLVLGRYSFNHLLTPTESCEMCGKAVSISENMYLMNIEFKPTKDEEQKLIIHYLVCEECKNRIVERIQRWKKIYFEKLKSR
jgi:uncharacterized protein YlaI